MNKYVKCAIDKIENGWTLDEVEYSELLKCAFNGGTDGQEACNAIRKAREYSGYHDPFKYIRYRDDNESYYASKGISSTGSCYITTACMKHYADKFDDNCYELTTLRNFRDSYIKTHYPEIIEQYYEKAPKLVKIIESSFQQENVWNTIYKDMILKTVNLIEQSQFEVAFLTYRDYFIYLNDKYLKDT